MGVLRKTPIRSKYRYVIVYKVIASVMELHVITDAKRLFPLHKKSQIQKLLLKYANPFNFNCILSLRIATNKNQSAKDRVFAPQ